MNPYRTSRLAMAFKPAGRRDIGFQQVGTTYEESHTIGTQLWVSLDDDNDDD
jgi:hypothetical protein